MAFGLKHQSGVSPIHRDNLRVQREQSIELQTLLHRELSTVSSVPFTGAELARQQRQYRNNSANSIAN